MNELTAPPIGERPDEKLRKHDKNFTRSANGDLGAVQPVEGSSYKWDKGLTGGSAGVYPDMKGMPVNYRKCKELGIRSGLSGSVLGNGPMRVEQGRWWTDEP